MVSMPMIRELAELLGWDDEVRRMVANADSFPEGRDDIYALLQARVRRAGIELGKKPAFGLQEGMPTEGKKIGDVLTGDKPHGECRLGLEALPGNIGIFAGSSQGKSSLAYLLCEYWIEIGLCVVILDVFDQYGALIRRFETERLLVVRARHFPLGVFVNPVGSRLSPMAWLSTVIGVLRECMFLRDGSCNLLFKIVGGMYRERGVLDGSGDYPTLVEAFKKLVTNKFSVQSRHAGYLETLVNRFQGLLQSFPGMNAKQSVIPEQVLSKSLVIRMGDLSPAETDEFTSLFLAWMMACREAKE